MEQRKGYSSPIENLLIETIAAAASILFVAIIIGWLKSDDLFLDYIRLSNDRELGNLSWHWSFNLLTFQIAPALAVLAVAYVKKQPFSEIFGKKNSVQFPWIWMLSILFATLILAVIWNFAKGIVYPSLSSTESIETFIEGVAYSTVAPISEEIIFRGVLLQLFLIIVRWSTFKFSQNNSVHPLFSYFFTAVCIGLTSVIFAKVHGDLYPFWPQFFGGIIYSIAFLISGKLYYPIVLHCLWNGIIHICNIFGINKWIYQYGFLKLLDVRNGQYWYCVSFWSLVVLALVAICLLYGSRKIILPSDQ